MMQHRVVSALLILILPLHIKSTVDSVTGDSGSPQTGALTISGGTSGAIFDSTTSTITTSFNFLQLPATTTTTNGQILFASEAVLHGFPSGNQNFFVGNSAGNFSIIGSENAGFGTAALNSLTAGGTNTGIGKAALASLTDGNDNTAVGASAGISLVNGVANIFIGSDTGGSYTSTESNNIIIGTGNAGTPGESNVIRLGSGQSDCYIDGIYGESIDIGTGLPAFVDAFGKIGTIVSSVRFKDSVKPIGNDSAAIFKLNPVEFYLKNDPSKTKLFGLIAEEVNKVFPELVVKDKHGNPYSVRYYELQVLLLNEMQKMADHIVQLEARIAKLEKACAK